ncbi:MAG: endonuclease Q family protein [Chitinophagaceae bacterium]
MYAADLHIHSHYASCTSKDLTLEKLYQWAQVKGIGILGTGDFTHPGWLAELETKLIADDSGLFQLRNPSKETALSGVSPAHTEIKFCLSAEVSAEYGHQNKKRVVHQLLYVPDFDTAKKINKKLSRYADLNADGRLTIFLSSRNLLEIVLESSDRSYLVPAHAWTPWNAVFGSKNGHSSLEDCYGDLAPSIFALETGLSSDPAMNSYWSDLDHLTMMSNSDAHSLPKLGRELNLLDTDKTYDGLFNAVKTKKGFLGTLEFFPEEGKYTYDGHRECKVCFSPEESRNHDSICPVCKKQVTIGAMHQVERLSHCQLPSAYTTNSKNNFRYIVPLQEILSEIHGTSVKSNKVAAHYNKAIAAFGNEFTLLADACIEDINRFHPLLGKAIDRMRSGNVKQIIPGFDNQYGKILLFEKHELVNGGTQQLNMFSGN